MDPRTKPSLLVDGITYFANLVILNVLFIICSLPLITYGAALSALYTMMRRLNEGETVVMKGFFCAFRDQFRQATAGWLAVLLPGAVMMAEAFALLYVNVEVPAGVFVCLLVPAAVYCGYLPWVLIQPSYFACTLKQSLKNALLLAVQLLPQTVVMAVVQLLPTVLFLFRPVDLFKLWPMWLFFYFGAAYGIVERIVRIPMERLMASLRGNRKPEDKGDE